MYFCMRYNIIHTYVPISPVGFWVVCSCKHDGSWTSFVVAVPLLDAGVTKASEPLDKYGSNFCLGANIAFCFKTSTQSKGIQLQDKWNKQLVTCSVYPIIAILGELPYLGGKNLCCKA